MYIWTGCKLPGEFESQLRACCVPIARELGLNISGFSLPQHISLKISFDGGDRYSEILDAIGSILRRESPFTVMPTEIQQHGSILWISFRENETLRRLHELLDHILEQSYHIPQHPFDKQFFFHSALFLGAPEKITLARAALADFPLPPRLEIRSFLQGVSETGKSGDFRVIRQIDLSDL